MDEKIDSYLRHAFSAKGSRAQQRSATDAAAAEGLQEPDTVPVLVRVVPERFDPAEIPGLTIMSDLRTILAGTATRTAIGRLAANEAVISVEAGRDGFIESVVSFEFVGGSAVQTPPRSENGSEAIIAVIDTGIDVLHEAFLDGSGDTRIEAIWDQSDHTGPTPKALGIANELDFGTVHTRVDIEGYRGSGHVPPRLGRDTGTGHGTHVASIAAGRAAGHFSGGMAPGARIVFVKPKLKTADDDQFSLGYSVGHAAALTFIDAIANQLALPVVVNASLGMNAGAHDGSSLLEAAFDEFSSGGRRAGRCIIKSAGNERARKVHAEVNMITGVTETVEWVSKHDHYSGDSVELWFPSEDEYSFWLIDPNGERSARVDLSQLDANDAFSNGVSYGISLSRYFRDNGDARLLVTVSSGLFNPIPEGTFKLEIFGDAVKSAGRIDAWIERDNFRPVEFATHESDEMTISIPGTARTVIAVGSIGHTEGIRSSSFSSRGLSRDGRNKPDISAPGEAILAASSGTTDHVVAQSGTSMAAPHVSGAVALAMSHCRRNQVRVPNAMQIAAALRATVRNYGGRHTTTYGYGILDATAFFDAITKP